MSIISCLTLNASTSTLGTWVEKCEHQLLNTDKPWTRAPSCTENNVHYVTFKSFLICFDTEYKKGPRNFNLHKVYDTFWTMLRWLLIIFSSDQSNLNPLSPNINMHVLLSVPYVFLMVLVGRICTNIKTFHVWWSLPLFSWPVCLIK